MVILRRHSLHGLAVDQGSGARRLIRLGYSSLPEPVPVLSIVDSPTLPGWYTAGEVGSNVFFGNSSFSDRPRKSYSRVGNGPSFSYHRVSWEHEIAWELWDGLIEAKPAGRRWARKRKSPLRRRGHLRAPSAVQGGIQQDKPSRTSAMRPWVGGNDERLARRRMDGLFALRPSFRQPGRQSRFMGRGSGPWLCVPRFRVVCPFEDERRL